MRLAFLVCALMACLSVQAETLKKVPARFNHDRITVVAKAPDGNLVTFYTDTGGGYNRVRRSVVERLRLKSMGDAEDDGKKYPLVEYPALFSKAGLPKPVFESWQKGVLVAVDNAELDTDGFFGSRWFAGRVWAFDYPKQTLRVGQSWQPRKNDVPIALGFAKNQQGVRVVNFPRITISIDGESFPMLLDTGATAQLSQTAAREFSLPEKTSIGTSYMIHSVFEKWIARHPDWQVIEKAEIVTGHAFRMIAVPQVTIGNATVGPVWFSERPDSSFHEYMSPMMDQKIDGAIGGSAFKYCRFVIDYPNAVAYFQRSSR